MEIKEYLPIIKEIKEERVALKDFETSKTRYQKIIEYNVTNKRGYGILPRDNNFSDELQAWLFLAQHKDEFNTSELSAERRINFDEFKDKFCTNDLEVYSFIMGKIDKDEILLIDFMSGISKNGYELLEIGKELYKKK